MGLVVKFIVMFEIQHCIQHNSNGLLIYFFFVFGNTCHDSPRFAYQKVYLINCMVNLFIFVLKDDSTCHIYKTVIKV